MSMNCAEVLTLINNSYFAAGSQIEEGWISYFWLNNHSSQWPTSTYQTILKNLCGYTLQAVEDITQGSPNFLQSSKYPLPYYLTFCLGGMDMDDIINAMMSASFDQLQHFVGIEDAYRVALWNAPFNADFYAGLARGFQKWP